MTAVEFIEQQYNTSGKLTPVDFYQAKEMEKQQIIDAYQQGFNNAYFANPLSKEQYYKETYNLSQQDKP
jgi:hypothetical protein